MNCHLIKSILATSLLFSIFGHLSAETPVPTQIQTDSAPEADRQAILAMAGEFEVKFSFHETASFKKDYQLAKPYKEQAHELVMVVKDEPGRIELQHLLVHEGDAIKHWRQVWTYQDTRIYCYQGGESWTIKTLPTEQVRGTWTQLVTQIDDSPRYEGIGRWTHHAGVSQWISGDTWRPLPRRESKRSKEYQVIAGTNRHTLTADGWVHEQDNTKLVVSNGVATSSIAREVGTNHYRRLDQNHTIDFSAAKSLWEKESAFWNQVLSQWDLLQSTKDAITFESSSKLKDFHKAIDQLKDKEYSKEIIHDTICGFLTSQAPAQLTEPDAPQ